MVTLDEIRVHNHVLTPGRYVGAAESDADDVLFEEQFAPLKTKLEKQFAKSHELETIINRGLVRLVNGLRIDTLNRKLLENQWEKV